MKFIQSLLSLALIFSSISAIQQLPTDAAAGVMLLEEYMQKNGTTGPAIILFRDKKTGHFSEGGGSRNKGEDLRYTASRELKEESLNTFRLNAQTLYDANALRHHRYVCYFIRVSGPLNKNNQTPLFSSYYHHNMHVLAKAHTPHDWRETNGMTRVFIAQLEADYILNSHGDFRTRDVYGNVITITGRTAACIRNALHTNLLQGVYVGGPLMLNENLAYSNSNHPFLKGTKVYWN